MANGVCTCVVLSAVILWRSSLSVGVPLMSLLRAEESLVLSSKCKEGGRRRLLSPSLSEGAAAVVGAFVGMSRRHAGGGNICIS